MIECVVRMFHMLYKKQHVFGGVRADPCGMTLLCLVTAADKR